MKPLCELCGDRHEKHQAHRFATNTGATNENATNSASKEMASEGHLGGAVHQAEKTKNRRSREAYNAYQREYMRKRRAK